jgi:predicted nucleic acid-binding protein
MSELLVDSGVLILAVRGRPEAIDALERSRRTGALRISVISRSEILARMHEHERERTQGLLSAFVGLAVTGEIADLAGSTIYLEARRGQTISLPDALIGATARIHDLDLLTTNPAHFPMLSPARVVSLLPPAARSTRRDAKSARMRGRT